jgi:hypothetical protein
MKVKNGDPNPTVFIRSCTFMNPGTPTSCALHSFS